MRQSRSVLGFTMVEALIVGVIVGVLAITATMIYGGYVRESKQQTVNSLAETTAAAANAYNRRTGNDPTVDVLNLPFDLTKYTVGINPGDRSILISNTDNPPITATAHY